MRTRLLIRGIASPLLAILLATVAAAQLPPEQVLEDEFSSDIIGQIGKKRVRQGETLNFSIVSPSAPNPNIQMTATDLPPGAAFTDLGNGHAAFSWTPTIGQEGEYLPFFNDEMVAKSSSAGGGQPVPLLAGGYPLSHGFYRIPYGNTQQIRVSRDHVNHSPPIKEDWIAIAGGPSASIPVVAAADGRVRSIADHNTVCCADNANSVNCSACNNSVWIEHANGEWTKYSHFKTGSVTALSGGNLDTNDCVVQGQLLGYEGDVGHTSGSGRLQTVCATPLVDTTKRCSIHCHWEVRFNQDEDFLRVPIMCGVSGGIAYAGDTILAQTCDGFGCLTDEVIGSGVIGGTVISIETADNSITSSADYGGSTSTAYFAGNRVRLLPGFAARTGVYFHAMIKACEDGTNGCPPL